MIRNLFLSLVFVISCQSFVQAQFTINLNPTAGMSQDSIDGFRQAADYWESVFTDNATVNIDIDFTNLGAGILGQAGSTRQVTSIQNYYTALANDTVQSTDDLTAVANLSPLTGGTLDFRTQVNTEGGSLAVSLDNDGSANNRFLALNTANAKALGLFTGNASAADASIAFNSSFSWDFDQTDGVGAGLQDFVGVAVHEIGHALGFVSGVDSVDESISSMDDLDGFAVFSGWDMFRYSAADGVVDLSAATASYFSIDGGVTNLGTFETGALNGSGFQASHWTDNMGLGIMDPTAQPPGNVNVVTQLDLMAFDVIGWDLRTEVVPEPSSALFLGFAIGCATLSRRRKSIA